MSGQKILERRYRRLIACYPADYRAAYGEEMLAVALAAAEPGARWPDPGEAADLIYTGLRRRLGSPRPALLNPAWHDAGGIAAVIGPVVMAAFAVAPILSPGGWHYFATATYSGVIVAAAWFAVAVAGMLGWRRLALAGSGVLSAGLICDLAWGAHEPYRFGALGWKIVFAALIVGSALLALKAKQRLLPWWAATATAVIAMLLAVLPAFQGQLPGNASFTAMNSYMQLQKLLYEALPAGLLLVLLVVVARQKAGVRARLMIMLVAGAVTFAVSMAAFSGILGIEDPVNYPPLGPGWGQSPAVLVAVPVICFAVGMTCLTPDERRHHRRPAARPGRR